MFDIHTGYKIWVFVEKWLCWEFKQNRMAGSERNTRHALSHWQLNWSVSCYLLQQEMHILMPFGLYLFSLAKVSTQSVQPTCFTSLAYQAISQTIWHKSYQIMNFPPPPPIIRLCSFIPFHTVYTTYIYLLNMEIYTQFYLKPRSFYKWHPL